VKRSSRFGSRPFCQLVIFALCAQLACPFPASGRLYAADGQQNPVEESKNLPSSQEYIDLGLDTNYLQLLSQRVVDGEVWNTSKFRSSRPHINIPPGKIQRALMVDIGEDGSLELRLPGYIYTQIIDFEYDQEVTSVATDSEFVFILTNQNRLYSISLTGMEMFLFQSSIPVFAHGQLEGLTDGGSIGLSLIQRRHVSPNKTKRGQEKNVYRISAAQELELMTFADDRTVASKKIGAHHARYIPLDEKLRPELKYLTHGDIAVVSDLGKESHETIIDVIPRLKFAVDASAQFEGLKALLSLSSKDSVKAMANLGELKDGAKKELAQIIRDPELRGLVHPKGPFSQSLYGMAFEGVEQGKAHVDGFIDVEELDTSSKKRFEDGNARPFRDKFTEEEWRQDSKYFNEQIGKVEHYLNSKGKVARYLSKVAATSSKLSKSALNSNGVRRLTYMLGGGTALAAGGSYYFGSAEVSTMALELMSANLKYFSSNAWNLLSMETYRPLIAMSMTGQASLPFIIYGVMGLFSRFSQVGMSQLTVRNGVRAFAKIFQVSPLRFFSMVTGQKAPFHAAKDGVVTAPVFPLAFNEATRNWRQAGHKRIDQKVLEFRQQKALKTLVNYATSIPDEVESEKAPEETLDYGEVVSKIRSLAKRDLNSLSTDEFYRAVFEVRTVAVSARSLGLQLDEISEWENFIKTPLFEKMLKTFSNYSEDIYRELSNADPDAFTSRYVTRGLFIDYLASLPIMAFLGDWANPATPEKLHAQDGEFLWTHPMATSENVNQLGIHLGRSAATIYLMFSKKMLQINAQHQSAELVDNPDEQVLRTKPLATESKEFLGALLDIRNASPGIFLGQSMYKGRVLLMQSTLLSGLVGRMFFGYQDLETAILGQLTFMGVGIWGYGWPWVFLGPAQSNHEGRIAARWDLFTNLQATLNQAWRLKDAELAHVTADAMLSLYGEGDFKYDSIPKYAGRGSDKSLGDVSLNFASDLYKFSKEKPAVASRHSKVVSSSSTLGASILTTYLASYVFSYTFGYGYELKWGGVDLMDWNYFTGIPMDDGAIAITVKSGIMMVGAYLANARFNILWDKWQLKRKKSRSLVQEAEMFERSLAQARLQEAKVTGPIAAALKGCRKIFSLD